MVVADPNIPMGSLGKMPDDIEKGGKIWLKTPILRMKQPAWHASWYICKNLRNF